MAASFKLTHGDLGLRSLRSLCPTPPWALRTPRGGTQAEPLRLKGIHCSKTLTQSSAHTNRPDKPPKFKDNLVHRRTFRHRAQ